MDAKRIDSEFQAWWSETAKEREWTRVDREVAEAAWRMAWVHAYAVGSDEGFASGIREAVRG